MKQATSLILVLAVMLLSADIVSGALLPPVTEVHNLTETGLYSRVHMDGNLTIVGAPRDADNGFRAGAAYVYDTATGTELYKLTASDTNAYDLLGQSVAVSGNYAVVGAIGKEDVATGTGSNYGAAYVFDLTTGGQVAKLVASAEMPMVMVGARVAIDGNNIVVGAGSYDTGGVDKSGAVFHYDLSNLLPHASAPGTFIENRMLTSPRSGVEFGFGGSLDLDGAALIVGESAPAFQDFASGMAHLFDLSTGTLLGSFVGDDTNLSDCFGMEVAIDGNMAAVGSYSLNTVGVNSGTAYVFDITDPAAVVQDFKLEEAGGGGSDNFSLHLDLEDGMLAVTAQNDDDGFNNAGSAFLFDPTTGAQLQKFYASDAAAGGLFGYGGIAISGPYLAVGASGHAYIFEDSAVTPGDFDGDRDVDADDIDLLADAIEAGSSDLTYDVNGDSVVDELDLVVHVATLVERTDGGVGTYRGDFNLDGYVDATDLAILKAGFGLTGLGYALGNANTDDFVDGTDLAIFKATFGFSGTPGGGNPPAVPEPTTLFVMGCGAIGLLRRRRRT
ncbi:MAG: dockerin type I domain-containing protein [Planctomycetota bacterium]|jgi:hypothetical protein